MKQSMGHGFDQRAEPTMTIEIHDVTPRFQGEVSRIHRTLRSIGVDRPTLLVVPAFEDLDGRAWDLRSDPAFVRWLAHEQSRGVEMVLHGLTHRAAAAPPPKLGAWMMHHWYSRGCAEFAHVAREEGARRLRIGASIFDDCGLETIGFVAPAWQQSRAAFEALKTTRLRYTAFFGATVDLRTNVRVRSPVLTFSAPGPVSDHAKRAFMRGHEAFAAPDHLLRVAIHPEDVHAPGRMEHITTAIRRLLRRRRVVQYLEVFGEGMRHL